MFKGQLRGEKARAWVVILLLHRFVIALLLLAAGRLVGETLAVIPGVELQPLQAQSLRAADALAQLGEPLSAKEVKALKSAHTAVEIQNTLDPHCLAAVVINPEARVQAQQGPARPELIEKGWRTFLVKVQNQAGLTAPLQIDSPNAGQIANRSEEAVPRRFLDLAPYTNAPMRNLLSGLAVEYRILQISSRDSGKREAKLTFDIGSGSRDLAFRSELPILFTITKAAPLTFHVIDSDGRATTARFLIQDEKRRVYPAQSKRLAPDFFFQPQVYRADGESVLLAPGEYDINYTRGPEYLKKHVRVKIGREPVTVNCKLERWIDPARLGWYSGDHHVHAAGCAHYEKPTEGVYPADMMRHITGEDLKVGSVLSWGPGWYFQKTFFEGHDNDLSTAENRMHYDVEVSGFPSSHTGHLVLLGLKKQDYPGTKRIEDWPSWGIPILQWAKQQGAVTGFAHSGWGLALKEEKLPSLEMPPFDGIGANEYIVAVTRGLVDFISTVDTPYPWELNIWYHTLNAGFRTRISGETDFPCISDERVGMGRSYVWQPGPLSYNDWTLGIREGRSYVSDGKSHLLDFRVNELRVGENGSELRLPGPQLVQITARVAALLDDLPNSKIAYDVKPYWDLERARVGGSQKVPVELIVNGTSVATKEITADGSLQAIEFGFPIERSSWIALRILPSSHTNPVFVVIARKPIRASRASAEWCLRAVDQCWIQKNGLIRVSERGEAVRAYEHAREVYRKLIREMSEGAP